MLNVKGYCFQMSAWETGSLLADVAFRDLQGIGDTASYCGHGEV